MARIKSFVKVSGDEFRNPGFHVWVAGLPKEDNITICVGGGTQINEEFARRGFPVRKHGPLGREAETPEQYQVATDVLTANATELSNTLLLDFGVHARAIRTIMPILTIGGKSCHVNGDLMVCAAYLGYDKLFVITTKSRQKAKTMAFAHLPKVQVIALD